MKRTRVSQLEEAIIFPRRPKVTKKPATLRQETHSAVQRILIALPKNVDRPRRKKKITWKDVDRRLRKMRQLVASSVGRFSPDDIMAHLDRLELMWSKRDGIAKRALKRRRRKK